MKARFGKKLIEEYLPQWDLTHIVDTSGAYIPGHGNPDGTPTVVLFARNRQPTAATVRTVMGLRSEPGVPEDISKGVVWTEIVGKIDQPGARSDFVSVLDIPRSRFLSHPWSIGGGGVAELKEFLDKTAPHALTHFIERPIGRAVRIAQEDIFMFSHSRLHKIIRNDHEFRGFLKGDGIRDWRSTIETWVWYPYVANILKTNFLRYLWVWRTTLRGRVTFQGNMEDAGLVWYEYQQHTKSAYTTPLSIAYAFTATHNHFVLDRGGNVFKQTAPVIKLPKGASYNDHISLLGLLNSSVGCFWLRQVSFPRGGYAAGKWEERFNFNSMPMEAFPVPLDKPLALSRRLTDLANELLSFTPSTRLCGEVVGSRAKLQAVKQSWLLTREAMIALQEELDWQCYKLYGLAKGDLTFSGEPPRIQLGQRAFEILMARKMAAGELETTWFERHGSTPITEIPAEWPETYRELVERRIELIETNRNISLIEQPEYKRRWNTEPWKSQLERALWNWLLDRLESYFDFDGRMHNERQPTAKIDIGLISTTRLVDAARQDTDFMQVGELYRNDPAFDVTRLITELVKSESVPLLPVLRYKASGLRKRREWEETWELQRREDAVDARTKLPKDDPQYLTELQAQDMKYREIGNITVPSKYKDGDFQTVDYWRLRGELDVPKERWVSFPHCEGADGMLMIAWAGYDHLQLARAISAYYVDIQERLGGRDDPRLVPLLACLIELLPWLKQWHNEVDPEFGMQMGDYFEGFIQEEARQMGKTLDQIRAWEPPKKTTRRRKRAAMES